VIKATGRTGDGRPVLPLGLSGENVARLAADEPISFDLAEVNMAPCQVIILYGRTEQAIAGRLRAYREGSR
jgi:hypothetical protein